MTQDQRDKWWKMVMHMRAVGGDRRVEMEADYKPAAEDILTSCGNNSNARANAWVDDLTGGMKKHCEKRCWKVYETPRKSSCSVWQQRTAHDTSCDDDDGGWKEASQRIVAKHVESNPVETPTVEPNSRHTPLTDDQKALPPLWTTPGLVILKVGAPLSCQNPHLVPDLSIGPRSRRCYSRHSMDAPFTNLIPWPSSLTLAS
jgi:hypothetical protein